MENNNIITVPGVIKMTADGRHIVDVIPKLDDVCCCPECDEPYEQPVPMLKKEKTMTDKLIEAGRDNARFMSDSIEDACDMLHCNMLMPNPAVIAIESDISPAHAAMAARIRETNNHIADILADAYACQIRALLEYNLQTMMASNAITMCEIVKGNK